MSDARERYREAHARWMEARKRVAALTFALHEAEEEQHNAFNAKAEAEAELHAWARSEASD